MGTYTARVGIIIRTIHKKRLKTAFFYSINTKLNLKEVRISSEPNPCFYKPLGRKSKNQQSEVRARNHKLIRGGLAWIPHRPCVHKAKLVSATTTGTKF